MTLQETSSPSVIAQELGYETRVLKSPAEIEEIRELWTSWQDDPNANFELFQLLLKYRKEVLRPNVVVLSRRATIEAILLGRLEHARVPMKLGYLTLWKPRVRSLIVMRGGFIGSRSEDVAQAAVKGLMDALAKGEADRIYISNQREDSPMARAALTLPGLLARDFAAARSLHRSMEIPPNPGDFLRRLKSKHRSWIKSKIRGLEARFPGSVSYRVFLKPEDLAQAVAHVEEVARQTYHRGMGVGLTQDVLQMDTLAMEARGGRLRICILYAGGLPRAFWIGMVYGSTFHSGFTGYDPAMREHELGTLVFVHLIDRLCEEKVKTLDFGLGDAFYKERFGDAFWTDVSISIYRPSLRGAVLKLAFTSCFYFDRLLRSVAQKLKMVNWVKRAWRSRLARGRAGS